MSINTNVIYTGDALDIMRYLPDASVALVITSPPYEAARTYGIDFAHRGDAWVDWAVPYFLECYRVCRGATVWVVAGQTRKFVWSATPMLLQVALMRNGVTFRVPPIFHRHGIPGSGGPDGWRNDYEFCLFATHGRLPWSDNTANGHPPLYAPGGAMSHRLTNGSRRNEWGGNSHPSSSQGRKPNGERKSRKTQLETVAVGSVAEGYAPPKLANAGNVIKCKVGGGHMGKRLHDRLASQNEAPFPESLVEPFEKCFCPPGGIVLDCFCGSGTSLVVAERLGRRWIGIDVRQSQAHLASTRVALERAG